MNTKTELKDLIDECFEESKKQGYDGEFCDFEFTEHDLDWIVEQFGRKPTFDEWWEAGFSESAIKAWLSAYTQRSFN